MTSHDTTTTRNGRAATAPERGSREPSLPKEDVGGTRERVTSGHNQHELGIDDQLNARFEHGLRADDSAVGDPSGR